MTRARRPWSFAGLAVVASLGIGRSSSAHPAGFTSVNRYVGVSCTADGRVAIAYLLDFAELPATVEIDHLDANGDGVVSPDEQRAYLDRRLSAIVAQWHVDIDGATASLRVTGSSLEVVQGEQGRSTLRIAADIAAEVAPPVRSSGGDLRVHVVEPVFADRSGWREMVAEPTADVRIVGGPSGSGREALSYGEPAAGEPPRIDDAVFTFRARERPDTGPPAGRIGTPAITAAVGGAGMLVVLALARWTRRSRPRA